MRQKVYFWSKSKKVCCKAVDFLWKKSTLNLTKNKRRPMQRPNKNALLCINAQKCILKIKMEIRATEFPSVK